MCRHVHLLGVLVSAFVVLRKDWCSKGILHHFVAVAGLRQHRREPWLQGQARARWQRAPRCRHVFRLGVLFVL